MQVVPWNLAKIDCKPLDLASKRSRLKRWQNWHLNKNSCGTVNRIQSSKVESVFEYRSRTC